ncbi:VCBS repeat-containing protein [Actinomadura sp. ATCC 31491]|uniref:VCBS repeat-containing protein n=1 Tax=Actinomadura luzonensis TaxID=2805427 RepID=A0ABT0G146_9ACTN|nr:FG-GAP and VCBS repeat-containing protein [Actinomadura luzonensis]MCK2218303.1 VCBS repeat-containing protein [Actinomadura luzonensis]
MRIDKISRSAAALAVTLTALTAATAPARAAAPLALNTDFNGDGYNDLAVGSPGYPGPWTSRHSGLIAVLYGGPGGFTGVERLRPESACYIPPSGECRQWGTALAAGDLDGNGRPDLVSTGSADLQTYSWSQTYGITRQHYQSETYRSSLSVVQEDADPKPDVLGIYRDPSNGWPSLGGRHNGNAFELYRTSPTRDLTVSSAVFGDIHNDGIAEAMVIGTDRAAADNPYLWYLDDLRNPSANPFVMGGPQACAFPETSTLACPRNDSKLALGDVNGDGHRDLIMVTPSTGTINAWYGDKYGGGMYRPGFSARNLTWLQTTAATLTTLATGDFDGDGAAELAVGMPGAEVSGRFLAGAVALVPGSPSGPVVSATRIISQDGVASPGGAPAADPIGEQSVAEDLMGYGVSILDLDGDGKGELIAGVPGKNEGRGMLAIMKGTAGGVPSTAQLVRAEDIGLTAASTRLGAVILH